MRAEGSFQGRLTALVALLLLVVIVALYVSVRMATETAVREQAGERLEAGLGVFRQLLGNRAQQLSEGVEVLAADFGFREAVATGDRPTMHSVMLNQSARIGADVVVLLDTSDRVIASSLPSLAVGSRFDEATMPTDGSPLPAGVAVVVLEKKPFLLVSADVKAPLLVARVVMGFHMGTALARQLRDLSGVEVSFSAVDPQGEGSVESTLGVTERQHLLAQWHAEDVHNDLEVLFLGERSYLTEELLLAGGTDHRAIAFVHIALDDAMAQFHALDTRIFMLSLVALLVSLVGAQLVARGLMVPVRRLVEAAERVGQGDYRTQIKAERNDELGRLAGALNHMQHAIAERERQLAHNALHDPVTGLPNRLLTLERLGNAMAAGRPTALLLLAVSNLKAAEEVAGPGSGDQALQQLCARLRGALPVGASLSRPTPDALAVQLDGDGADAAVLVADGLLLEFMRPIRVAAHEIRLEGRCGIACFPSDAETAEDLLRRAGIALGDAASHPGRLQLYQQGRDDAHQRQITLARDLRNAGANNELLLHFQPKLDLTGKRVRQAEALLRWQHPSFGMVSPGEFIPLAERTGSIQGLTAWVIDAVLKQQAEWNARGLLLQISLNISADDLMAADLSARVAASLERYAVSGEQLVFEITESAVMQDQARALTVLHELRALGIQLSVDDFGTGYSSLAQLKRMPVQELKIDQSFIRELDETSDDAVIVRSTIDMSHALGLKVVAEGVEHEHSLRLLERWRCDVAQGYLISRPLAAQPFEQWLANFLPDSQVQT